MTDRACGWCRGDLSATARADALYCGQRCRQASHRFRAGCVARARATHPIRLAYADPPYPGLSGKYRGHPDYAGEVDLGDLVERLQGFDGWALSTNARSLGYVLSLLAGVDYRVAAWFRGERPTTSKWPLSAWEPVVFAGGRRLPSSTPGVDALIYRSRARTTDPGRVIGAKPAAFAWWLFDLLGALPGDELVDMFPGSGGIGRAWDLYSSPDVADDVSRSSASHTSPRDLGHASRRDRGHASRSSTGHASLAGEHDPSLVDGGHASRRDSGVAA